MDEQEYIKYLEERRETYRVWVEEIMPNVIKMMEAFYKKVDDDFVGLFKDG